MGTVQNRLGAYVGSSGREKAQVIQRHTESLRTSAASYGLQLLFKKINNGCWLTNISTESDNLLVRIQHVQRGENLITKTVEALCIPGVPRKILNIAGLIGLIRWELLAKLTKTAAQAIQGA